MSTKLLCGSLCIALCAARSLRGTTGLATAGNSTLSHAISTPAAFHDSLLAVIKGRSCSTNYTVDKNIYGHLGESKPNTAFLDGRTAIDGRGHRAYVWFSDYTMLEMALNSETRGCCGADVTSLKSCGCRIAKAAGVTSCDKVDSYVVLQRPTQNGLRIVRPDWRSVIEAIPDTYSAVFRSRNLTAPTCDVSVESMVRTLQGLKEGGNSWNGVVRSDPATAKELDLHPGTTANETGISQLTAADFAALAREGRFCESPLAVRAYLARFMDANPLFRGDGVGPDGNPEFISFTNPKIADIGAGAHVTHIWLNGQ